MNLLKTCTRRTSKTFNVFDKKGNEIVKFRDLVLPNNVTEADLINYKLNLFSKDMEDDFSWRVNPAIVNWVDYKPSTYSEKLLELLVDFVTTLAKRDLKMDFDTRVIRFDITTEFYHRKSIHKETNFYNIRDYILKNFVDWSEFLIQPKIIYGLDITSERLEMVPDGLEELKLKDFNEIFKLAKIGKYQHQLPIFKKEYELTPRQTFIVMAEIIYQTQDSESEIHRLWQMNKQSFSLSDGWALIMFQNYFDKIGFKGKFKFEGNKLASTKLFFKDII